MSASSVSNIYKLLDKLEMTILKGIPLPLTPLIFVNNEKVIDTVDRIRASIPAEIQEAHNVIKKRDEIIIDAQKKSSMMIEDTKRQASILLSESELLKAVQAEAERIRQQVISDCEQIKKQAESEAEILKNSAINEAMAIRSGADRYAEDVLSSLDRDLGELHSIVRNGQKHLAKVKSDSLSQLSPQNRQKTAPNIAYQPK